MKRRFVSIGAALALLASTASALPSDWMLVWFWDAMYQGFCRTCVGCCQMGDEDNPWDGGDWGR